MAGRFTKYGIAIIAAVLLIGVCAGAASAWSGDATDWNNLGNTPTLSETTYTITGSGTINPKTSATLSASSAVLDFSGFTGTFAGMTTSGNNKGALFGSLNLGANTLEIKGLNMTSVTVTSSGNAVGGIIGLVSGTGTLNLTNCHLKDCTIKSTGGYNVGGLVGTSEQAVTLDDCSVENCKITGYKGGTDSKFSDVGGLIGYHTSYATIRNCTVANCPSITGTAGAVGGLVGFAKGKLTTTDCSVVNCTSITGTGNWIGGLAGVIQYTVADGSEVTRCNVLDCTVKSTGGYDVGGLVGQAWNSIVNFTGCTVANSTITSANYYDVGGLLGFSNNEVIMDDCSVDNCTITGGKDGEGFSDVGGLIGRHTSSATIRNCTVANCTEISGTAGAVGGLVGFAKGKLTTADCSVINCTNIKGTGNWIGGLVGAIQYNAAEVDVTRCNVLDCMVKSTGGKAVGGLVGQAYQSSVNFTGCTVANSTITSASYSVGGLVGEAYESIVNFTGCTVANSTITSALYGVGGLLGYSDRAVTMDDCSVDNCKITGAKGSENSDVGGLIGWHISSATIRNCTVANCISITGTGNNVGGMVGYAKGKLTTTDCSVVNCTLIKGTGTAVGGMVGYAKDKLTSTAFSVVNCSITSTGSWIGGLAGVIDVAAEVDVTRCNVLDCTVKSTGGYDAGGLVGQAWNSIMNFTGCTVANSTIASAKYDVGGLLGYSNQKVTMDNCSVENCKIESDNKDDKGYSDLGGLIGRVNPASGLTHTLTDCSVVNCSITGKYAGVGGLVGNSIPSSVNTITVTRCKVLDCTVTSTSGYEVGGMVGQAWYSIVNFAGCMVANSTITAPYSVGGLLGYAKNAVTIDNSSVVTCSIKGSGSEYGVGGLVGNAGYTSGASGNMIVKDCKVLHCDVVNGGYSVGGLVGIESGQDSSFERCTVANSTITSALYGVGGLLGYSDRAVTMDNCSVDNCKITGAKGSENSDVGGLIGWHISSATIRNCTVANCAEISGTGNNVGGLVGYAKGKLTTTDCSVVNCTSIQGKGKWIGGLVGGVKPESIQTHTFINCSVISCSITGTGAEIGGLIGNIDAESNVNTIIVTCCKVLDCTVQSTDGYEAGGMIGQAWYASVNFAGCMVENSTITALCSVGGLLGYAKNSVTIDNSSVVNCSIKRSGSGSKTYGVGGLVANAGYESGSSGNMIVKDCKVLHCDIVNDGGYVGGLVGFEYGQASSFERCIVANSTIASTAKYCVGGLLGYSNKAVTLGNCSVENCAITGIGKRDNGNAEVGGLAGHAFSITRSTNCEVKNCVIVAGGKCVGGLFGLIANDDITTGPIYELQGCSVKNSTISGTKDASGCAYAGGLVGYARSVTAAKTSDNKVEDCAVNGGESYTGLVSGKIESGASITCDTTGTNYLYPGSGDTIALCDKTGATCSVDADFWKKISYSTGQKSGSSAATVSNIGEYGKFGGFGVGSVSKYTVIYDGNDATSGTVPIDRSSPYASPYTINVTVMVLNNTGNLAKTGYTFGGWNTEDDGTGTAYAPGSTFIIDADTLLYAKWNADTYPVNFIMNGHGTQVANTTVSHGSTVAEPSPAPSADGYTFNGWYKDSGLSAKYDFATPVTAKLDLYANWTDNPYTITHTSSNPDRGTTAVNKTQAKHHESVMVEAYANAGYHFIDWTCINISGSSNNPYIFTMPAMNVSLTANFAENVTTVTYQNETGTTYETKIYTFNASAALPANPVKEGYTFNGWNITVGGHQYPFNDNETYFRDGRWVYPCANDTALTVNASWVPKTSTVTFHTDAGTEDRLNSFGQPVNFSATPTRPGYAFTIWNVSSSGLDLNSSTYVKNGTWNYTGPENPLHAYANWTLLPSEYVEVSDWEQLVAAVAAWNDTATMRTIVLTADAVNLTSGTDYEGIPVTGNITIKPALNIGELKIDGNQMGRIFDISSTGTLTLAGNGTATLNVTGGAVSATYDGGAISISGGNLTLTTGAKITNSTSGRYGGAVYLTNTGIFTQDGGTISGCSATQAGGAVYATNGDFILDTGTITGCDAMAGAGVDVSGATFTMNGGEISGCTASISGGGVYDFGTFIMNGGIIRENIAPMGAGVINYGTFVMNNTAQILADNDVALAYFSSAYRNIESSATFTGSVGNITLYDATLTENPEEWKGQIVVTNGSSVKTRFALSTQYTGYKLTEKVGDLVLGIDTPTNAIYVQLQNAGGNAVSVILNTSGGTHIETKLLAAGETNVTFSNLANGVYSIEGYYVSATGSAGVTKLVTLSGSEGAYVELRFPAENVMSEVKTTAESGTSAPKVVVDGLDAIAAAQPAPVAGTVILVEFNAVAEPYNATNEEQTKLKENITSTVPNAEIKYLNFSITKSDVDTSTGNTTNVSIIPDPAPLMTIYMEYDLNGRENLQVWRIHNNTAEEFRQLPAGVSPGDEYFVCDGNKGIYIYSKHFSTYTVSSSLIARPSGPTGGNSGSSSGNHGSSMWAQNPTVEPTVAPTTTPATVPAAPTALPTAQPTQKSPAPVAGLIVGLGIAAVLLRLRK